MALGTNLIHFASKRFVETLKLNLHVCKSVRCKKDSACGSGCGFHGLRKISCLFT